MNAGGRIATILNNCIVRSELIKAWNDSKPGNEGCHEEGGFIVSDEQGELSVVRWLIGQQNKITVPPHSNCRINDLAIIATFHTHPNLGNAFIQEPSEADRLAVRNDLNLKGNFYIGEFVISFNMIYQITPAGQVNEIIESDKYFILE